MIDANSPIRPTIWTKKYKEPKFVEIKPGDTFVYNPVDNFNEIKTVGDVMELARKAYEYDALKYRQLTNIAIHRLIQQELLPFFLLLKDYLRLKNVSTEATEKMKVEVSNFIMMFDGTLENCISKLFARIRTSESKESYKKALDQYQNDIEEERRKQNLL